MTSGSDLANSSLRDLLKICRSHSLQLPAQLPEDKQYYVDLILRHRRAMREAAASEGPGVAPATAANSSSSSAPISSNPNTSNNNSSSSSNSSFVSPTESQGSLSEGYVSVSSHRASYAEMAQEGKDAAEAQLQAADEPDAAAAPPLMQDIDYDEADEEEHFARSPAVQKITSILQNIAVFDYLERHTSIPRFYWGVLLVLLTSTSILLYVGPLAVCNFICFVYPAYRTFKTLEGKFSNQAADADGIEDDHSIEVHRYWLTYWVVYGLFRLFEVVTDFTLYWLPYYQPVKFLILLWLFHPSTTGCALVYSWVIRPLFLPREAQIDRGIERAGNSLTQAWSEVKSIILKKVAKRIAGAADDTPRKPAEKKDR